MEKLIEEYLSQNKRKRIYLERGRMESEIRLQNRKGKSEKCNADRYRDKKMGKIMTWIKRHMRKLKAKFRHKKSRKNIREVYRFFEKIQLFSEVELREDLSIASFVFALQVIEKLPTFCYHHDDTTT